MTLQPSRESVRFHLPKALKKRIKEARTPEERENAIFEYDRFAMQLISRAQVGDHIPMAGGGSFVLTSKSE
jgi:hypothetical protein